MKKQILFGAALLLLAASCKKDDKGINRREALTTGKWRLAAATSTVSVPGFGQRTSNDYDSLQDCSKDNLYEFRTDGAFVQDEGATRCNSGALQTATIGTWQLLDNDTRFRLNAQGISPVPGVDSLVLTGDILELNASTLRIRAIGTFSLPGAPVQIPYEVNQSFAKQ